MQISAWEFNLQQVEGIRMIVNKKKKGGIRSILLILLSCMLLSVSASVIYAYVSMDGFTRDEFVDYFLHKRTIDRRCQEVFCERLQPGMDVETVKTIILEEYDVDFILRNDSSFLGANQIMWMASQQRHANFFLFGRPSLDVVFNEGKYVFTYVNEFEGGYYLCEENDK